MFEYYLKLVRDADLQVFGRKTYELMVPYWPDVAKIRMRRKLTATLGKRSSPSTKLFFREHWTAVTMGKRESFA